MGPLWHSSSQSRNRRNPDGSNDVICYECGRFIGKTFEKIFRAKCALCEKAEQGVAVPEDVIRQYSMGKMGKEDVAALLIPKEPKLAKWSFNSITGYLLSALGIPREQKEEPRSVELARSKKRPRLFEDVNLGDMMDLDQKMRKPKE